MAINSNIIIDLFRQEKYPTIQKMLDKQLITPEYLEEFLKSQKNGYFIYQAMQNLKGIDTLNCWHTLIYLRDWYYLTKAAKNIPGVPLAIATEAILASDDIEAIYNYAQEIPNVDVKRFVLKALSLKTKYLDQNGYYITMLLKMATIKGSPMNIIAKEVFARDNFSQAVTYLQKSNNDLYSVAEGLNHLVLAKVQKGENSYCHYLIIFANNVSDSYLYEFAQTIIATDDAAWILMFAQSVKNAPMELLTNAIIATHDLEYIRIFRDCNFPFANQKALNDEIEKLETAMSLSLQKQKQQSRIIEFLLDCPSQVILEENKDYFDYLLPDETEFSRKRTNISHKN